MGSPRAEPSYFPYKLYIPRPEYIFPRRKYIPRTSKQRVSSYVQYCVIVLLCGTLAYIHRHTFAQPAQSPNSNCTVFHLLLR